MNVESAACLHAHPPATMDPSSRSAAPSKVPCAAFKKCQRGPIARLFVACFAGGRFRDASSCGACAEAIVQALRSASTENQKISLMSTEGEGPGQDADKWERLFSLMLKA